MKDIIPAIRDRIAELEKRKYDDMGKIDDYIIYGAIIGFIIGLIFNPKLAIFLALIFSGLVYLYFALKK